MSLESEISFELMLLPKAVNYQIWIRDTVMPFLGNRILECGAGIGNISKFLPVRERIVLSESDPFLLSELLKTMNERLQDPRMSVEKMELPLVNLEPWIQENFDTIVSFNVLEHVEDDRKALEQLIQILKQSQAKGPRRLVSFVPAHSWAYGSMDRSFGHWRRYSKRAMRRLCREIAPEAKLHFQHFNAFGLLGWVFNGRILKKSQIGEGTIEAFERLCPVLRPLDDFVHRQLKLPIGQSLLCVLEWT
jgi:SAM-dependent methyltransferase